MGGEVELGGQDVCLVVGVGTGAEGPCSGTVCFTVLSLVHALLSPLWVSKSVWSLSPNSLVTNSKTACSQAVENRGRPMVRYLMHVGVEGI